LDTCIESWTGTGEVFQYVQGWDTIRNGGGNTPDIFDECYVPSSPFESYDVPVNPAGFQYPKSGTGYSALVALGEFSGGVIREYIQGTLTQQLLNGNSYCVTLYVNLSNFSKNSGNSFAVYFDDGQITVEKFELPNVIPQIQNLGQQLDDTLSWMKIEESFIANGTEEYFTIGNFLSDDSSNVVESYPSGSYPGAYYYIDDVSVIDISTPAYAGIDTTIALGDSVFIGRQPEIGLNDNCVWYVNGNSIDTITGLWVMPDSTTTYILEQTICGYTTYDTVTVTVLPTSINELFKENNVRIYPNPSTGLFTIQLNNQHLSPATLQVTISNITGMIIKTEKISVQNNSANFNAELSNGIYFIHVKTSDGYQYSPQRITIIN